MKNFVYISLLFIAIGITSCGKKMIPQTGVVVSDSTIEKTIIKYRSDTVIVPGDTVIFVTQIPCKDVKLDTMIRRGRTTLQAKLSNGQLQVICKADSLLHIIDSLQTVITFKEKFHSEIITVQKPVEVVRYKTPKWAWYLSLISSLYIGARVLVWRYKIPVRL